MNKRWSIEFYEDPQGRRPVESWIDRLTDQKAQAVLVALEEVLAVRGLALASSAWLKALRGGLYEFRIRHSATQIRQMYKAANQELKEPAAEVLLRIFVAFEGNQVIVLLGAYDKGKNNKAAFQQEQIGIARKRLKEWRRRRG